MVYTKYKIYYDGRWTHGTSNEREGPGRFDGLHPPSLAGGIFIYKADEGETLLYASDYVIGFFGCASYEELADYVHHSFRGMVDLRDRELVEQNIRQQTASDVCQTSTATASSPVTVPYAIRRVLQPQSHPARRG